MNREFRALRQAVLFFTRLPWPSDLIWEPADLQRSSTYFPIVGWVVGIFAALSWYLGIRLWNPWIASGISLGTTLVLTGALHEDGFADVCDGFGGGYTKARVLEIMRDSRVGAFGAIGIAVMLGFKWSSVASLPSPVAMQTLVAAHALSRGTAISLLATMPYVREEVGKAKPLATHLAGGRLVFALVTAVLPLLSLPPRFWWCAVSAIAVRVVMASWFRHRIGGYTGDCLGATQQLTEIAVYLTVIALAK